MGASALAVALSMVVHAQSNGPSVMQGHDVFERWCAPCHAAGPFHAGTAGLQVKYRGSDESPVLEQRTDLTPAFVKQIVRHGVNAMPPFRKTEITDAELDAIAAYLSHNNPHLSSGS
jgi:mono/diheme cytochrome c family protein